MVIERPRASEPTAPLRVLHVITGLNTGGAEMMLVRLLGALDHTRFRHAVVSLRDKGTLGAEIERIGVPVHALGMPAGLPAPAGLRHLVALWRAFRPDIVQGWLYHANLAALLAAPLAGGQVPVVWGIHHSLHALHRERRQTRMVIQLGAWFSRRAAGAVFVSERSQSEHRRCGYRLRREMVIPNGFDTTAFRPAPEAGRMLRAELGVRDDVPLIGMAARYHPMKNHAGFLRAAAIAATQTSAEFVLAGTDVAPTNLALTRAVAAAGLGGRVHLLGPRRDMPHLLAGFDLLTTASTHGEAFPLIVGEAMACGTPCVVTDLGDCAELVGDSGIVVPPGDDRALAEAWCALLGADAHARQQRGGMARERILARYSLPSVAHRYQALYDALAGDDRMERWAA